MIFEQIEQDLLKTLIKQCIVDGILIRDINDIGSLKITDYGKKYLDDQDKFDRKGELTLAKFHQIVSKIDYLDKLGKNFHKVLVLTDFQAFVQTRKSLLNLGYNLERKSDMQKTEFSLKEYKNLFVIHEPFPILENNGWWKKQNYELTIPDILLGLKYGLLKKDEIPKLQELHYEKLKNVKGNFQEIIDLQI